MENSTKNRGAATPQRPRRRQVTDTASCPSQDKHKLDRPLSPLSALSSEDELSAYTNTYQSGGSSHKANSSSIKRRSFTTPKALSAPVARPNRGTNGLLSSPTVMHVQRREMRGGRPAAKKRISRADYDVYAVPSSPTNSGASESDEEAPEDDETIRSEQLIFPATKPARTIAVSDAEALEIIAGLEAGKPYSKTKGSVNALIKMLKERMGH